MVTLKIENSTPVPQRFYDEQLHETELTVGWLIESLRKNDKEFVKKYSNQVPNSVKYRDISEGKGMFSIVLKVGLHFDDSTYNTIVKIPGTYVFDKMVTDGKEDTIGFDEAMVEHMMVPMHNNECLFYTLIAPEVPEMLPSVFTFREWKYRENKIGYLHMEDLSVKGKNLDYFNCLSHGQIKNVIRHLAHLQKTMMTMDEDQWKNKFNLMKKMMSGFAEKLIDAFTKFKESCRHPALFENVFKREDYPKLICNAEFADYAYHQSYLDFGIPTTLVHGDIWTSNLMFKADSDGYATDEVAAILDWQLAHEGNLLIDFVRLLMFSCDGDVRREIEMFIFDFYMDCLEKELQGTGLKVTFNGEQLRKAYDVIFLAHSAHFPTVGPSIFNSRTVRPEEQHIEDSRQDKSELRGLHIFEDAIKIMDKGDFSKWLK